MSATQKTTDVFGIYENGLDSIISTINKSTSAFQQSITDIQEQCMKACENSIRAVISTQREFANRAGTNIDIPNATLTAIRDTNEQINNAYSIQNQIVQTTIDTTKQNIKSYTNESKAFADLNKNIIQSWITVFTPRS